MSVHPISEAECARLASHVACRGACPVGTHAGAYVALIAQGRDREAYRMARNRNPFASVCGRVCAHPCESACRRGSIDAPVSIRTLKRFATERFGVESSRSFEAIASDVDAPRPKTGRPGRVAIVGAGPAGLSCGHDLALMGHSVVVFDAASCAGGMMRQGIPAYRLPRTLLDREIDFIRWLGVEIRLGMEIGRNLTLSELTEEFDATFLAPGCRRGKMLNLPGHQLGGIMTALEFLARVNLGDPPAAGGRVLVIGGGNVAFDVARTASRLPPGQSSTSQVVLDAVGVATRVLSSSVTLVAVEDRDTLPADIEELVEAQRENVAVELGVMPSAFIGENGVVKAVRVQPVKRAFDDDGNFAPVAADEPPFDIECDMVVLAVGQFADLSFLGPDGPAKTAEGFVRVEPTSLETSIAGIYAGGDAAFGPRNLVDAVADGKLAARSIDTRITGRVDEPIEYRVRVFATAGYSHPFAAGDYDAISRGAPPLRPVNYRGLTTEVEEDWPEASARREAQRCVHCWVNTVFDCRELDATMCIECGGCVDVCPEMCIDLASLLRLAPAGPVSGSAPGDARAVKQRAPGAALLKDETRCIRCGLCARRCPVGAITMQAIDVAGESEIVHLADRTM